MESNNNSDPSHTEGRRGRRRRFKGVTEYNSTFRSHDVIGKSESIRPVNNLLANDGDMDMSTTQRHDFVTFPAKKLSAIRRSGEIEANQGPMDLRTSYGNDFTQKELTPRSYIKYSDSLGMKSAPKFSGNPTYKADFQDWGFSKRDLIRGHDEYVPSTEPLQDVTTFKSEFQPKRATPRKPKKPEENFNRSHEKMEEKTSHTSDFVAHPLPSRHKKEKADYKMSSAKFDGMTTSRVDYTAKEGGKQQSCKPAQIPLQSKDPFNDSTTANSDFREWEVHVPMLHQPDKYIKPSGEIDTMTTFKQDFPPRKIERAVAFKPTDRKLVEAIPFAGQTNYTQDFKKWEGHKPERGADPSRRPYEKPTQIFEGSTSYQNNFDKKQITPRKNYAPRPRSKENGEFYGTTSYGDNFVTFRLSGKQKQARKRSEGFTERSSLPKFEGMTTSRNDFVAKALSKQESFKPAQEPLNTKEPFQAATTSKADYKKWEVKLPKFHQPDIYVKPEGKIDMTTTSMVALPIRKIEKVGVVKPESRPLIDPGPFHHATGYSESFKQYEGHRPEKGINPSRVPYEKPDKPFVGGATNYQKNFERKAVSRREPFRPKAKEKENNDAFDSSTLYNDAFTFRTTKKRSPINPLKHGNYIMEYIGDSDDDDDFRMSKPMTTEKAIPSQPLSAVA